MTYDDVQYFFAINLKQNVSHWKASTSGMKHIQKYDSNFRPTQRMSTIIVYHCPLPVTKPHIIDIKMNSTYLYHTLPNNIVRFTLLKNEFSYQFHFSTETKHKHSFIPNLLEVEHQTNLTIQKSRR